MCRCATGQGKNLRPLSGGKGAARHESLAPRGKGCLRKPRIPRKLIGGDLPTPKEQFLFLPILSGRERPVARLRGLIGMSVPCEATFGLFCVAQGKLEYLVSVGK
jgi:hypothetical protein